MKIRTEFLFTHSAVPAVKELRGSRWRDLVTRIARLDSTHPDALAFALMMVRLNGCVACEAKRYRERGGCANCSRFVLTTLNKEAEASLMVRFRAAQKEIVKNLKTPAATRVAA